MTMLRLKHIYFHDRVFSHDTDAPHPLAYIEPSRRVTMWGCGYTGSSTQTIEGSFTVSDTSTYTTDHKENSLIAITSGTNIEASKDISPASGHTNSVAGGGENRVASSPTPSVANFDNIQTPVASSPIPSPVSFDDLHEQDTKISTGSIIGISIGSTAGEILLLVALFVLARRAGRCPPCGNLFGQKKKLSEEMDASGTSILRRWPMELDSNTMRMPTAELNPQDSKSALQLPRSVIDTAHKYQQLCE